MVGKNYTYSEDTPSSLVRPLPLVPPPLRCTTSVPPTRPARIEVRRDCGWWHVVLRTRHRADMSAPRTIEQHLQSVRQHSWPRTPRGQAWLHLGSPSFRRT